MMTFETQEPVLLTVSSGFSQHIPPFFLPDNILIFPEDNPVTGVYISKSSRNQKQSGNQWKLIQKHRKAHNYMINCL